MEQFSWKSTNDFTQKCKQKKSQPLKTDYFEAVLSHNRSCLGSGNPTQKAIELSKIPGLPLYLYNVMEI